MSTAKTNTKQLEEAYKELERAKARVLELRRSVPEQKVKDYEFITRTGERVTLSSLFGTRDELLLIHNMGVRCSYCTLWADGFNGVAKHLTDRAPFVVISPDPYVIMKEFAEERGWQFPIYSAEGTTFNRDMQFASEKNEPWPGVSTFRRDADGTMYRVASAPFGPGDDFCAVWHLLDLLPKGVNNWTPKYNYERTVKWVHEYN